MYKFLLFVLLAVVHLQLMTLQMEEQRAMHLLFELKHALNRAAHAAAQQSDGQRLAHGIRAIDEACAEAVFLDYLQANLHLDGQNQPLSASPLRQPVDILVFEVVNADVRFPYRYSHEEYGVEVTFDGPGVVAVLRAEYPRLSRFVDPIVWEVKGAAELLPVGG